MSQHSNKIIRSDNTENTPNYGERSVTPEPFDSKGYSLNSFIDVTGTSTPHHHIHNHNGHIKINRGLFLASDPTKLNHDWCLFSKAHNELLNHHLPLLKGHCSIKRMSKVMADMLNCLLANLLNAHNQSSQLIYSRDTSDYDNRSLIKIVDYLAQNQFIISVIGKANQYDKNTSWMVSTDKLVAEFDKAKVRVQLKDNTPMVKVRGVKGDLSLKRFKTRQALELKDISRPVESYNSLWLHHDVTLNGRYIAPYCKRIFNHSLELGGRFYGGGHLLMPGIKRQQLYIDNEPTCEPDFKSIHYSILYALNGIQLNDDPYAIEGYDRSVIKLASLVLLNSDNIAAFKANITKSANPINKRRIAEYKKDYHLFMIRAGNGLPATEPKKPRCSKGFISGKFDHSTNWFSSEIPDDTKGEDLYQAICGKHHLISDHFGTEDIGLRLQNIDSTVMASVITQLCALNVPCLPVHDSIRVKVSDKQTAVTAMLQAYKAIVGFNAVVEY